MKNTTRSLAIAALCLVMIASCGGGSGGGGGGGGGDTQTERLMVTNNCSYTIWIQQQNLSSDIPEIVELTVGESYEYAIPSAGQASTRIWPKAGCDSSGNNCTIGQSSAPCPTDGCAPPVDSKLEATWGCTLGDQTQCGYTPQGVQMTDTYWNTSTVDGYTLPFTATVTDNTVTDDSAPCDAASCSNLSISECPTADDLSQGRTATYSEYASADLEVENGSGTVIGCYQPCKKFNYPTYTGYGLSEDNDEAIMYCCPTPIADDAGCEASPTTCVTSAQCRAGPVVNTEYVTRVHSMCNSTTYAYAYDDAIGLRHCSAATKVHITFGPNCP